MEFNNLDEGTRKLLTSYQALQEKFVSELVRCDPKATVTRDPWSHAVAGGGMTILVEGPVFERGAVAFSHVGGTLEPEIAKQLTGCAEALPFEAFGTSIIVHPRSPMVPSFHANVRYISVAGTSWVGGGTDLTPHYLFEEDARSFHSELRDTCARFDPEYYPRFKKWCDEYFFLKHRGETRGVGGIFFDYLGREDGGAAKYYSYATAVAESIPRAYFPVVERCIPLSFTPEQQHFQKVRRGRYVEFNLLYDRGTLFGLKSGGRVESILMSMPPTVEWEYNFSPVPGSPEDKLLHVLRTPREWLS